MPSVMNLYVTDPSEELQRLWDESDVAWRDYVMAARKLRTRSPLKPSKLDQNNEQRAWVRVSDVRARIKEIMERQGAVSQPEILEAVRARLRN